MTTYLFYDTETTGLNPAFDQIVQFAAIRTDAEFRELERCQLRIKLRPDVIPQPQALLTHGITIVDLLQGAPEYEAIRQIHALVNTPETISIGYNSLSFDDTMLRFAFYRNLLTPYTHQFRDGCGRLDLYPFVVMFWLQGSDAVAWPLNEEGLSLRLEHLNAGNRLAQGPAHDALVDVEATLELARRLRAADPDLWYSIVSHFDGKSEPARLNEVPTDGYGLRRAFLVDGHYGAKQHFQVPALLLGGSRHYSNQSLWLRLDRPELQQVTPHTIDEHAWVIRKRRGDLPLFLTGKSPVTIDRDRLLQARENKAWLVRNRALYNEIVRYHHDFRYPELPNVDVDAGLYQNGFWSDAQKRQFDAFHVADVAGKMALASEFDNTAARELGRRLLSRNYGLGYRFPVFREHLDSLGDAATTTDWRNRPRPTAQEAVAAVSKLLLDRSLDQESLHVLQDLQAYLVDRWPAATYRSSAVA